MSEHTLKEWKDALARENEATANQNIDAAFAAKLLLFAKRIIFIMVVTFVHEKCAFRLKDAVDLIS